ncbi:MAG: FAD-dependent oxidoreductase, partial [Propionibacteriaceae bacterium]|nr:FAD-dependent oxidoreductase [Propionibacteriaceae bacterium]
MAREVDLAVVGAGAAGLLAAAAAKRLGFDVLVLESSGLVGGDTAVGSGRMWLPGTHLATSLGITDTPEAATDYLNAILGAETDASTAARRQAFAQAAPKLARWLAASNLPLLVERGVPDYHPASAGGRPEGRVLATTPTDRKSLGEWAGKLRSRKPADEAGGLTTLLRQFTHSEGYAATGGEALVAELLRRATANGADIWLDTTVEDIVQDGPSGSVTGLLVRKDGDQIEIRTRKGVLLAVGGFAGSQELREEYLPLP